MTKICVYRNKKDIVKYTVSGHTEFSEAGSDVVCAAISTLAYTTLNGLTDVVKIHVGYQIADGYLECILPKELSKEERTQANVLLETFYLSAKNLKEQYDEYITIMELEV